MASLKVMKGVAYTNKRLMQWLKEDGSVFVQPKRDEIRCVVNIDPETHEVTYTSASGKPLYNLECFTGLWKNIALNTVISSFDCGVMVDNSFDVTRSVLRSSKKKYDLSKRAVFFIYDIPSLELPYAQRIPRIESIVQAYWIPALSTPATYEVQDAESVDRLYTAYLERGHEGAMVKRINHAYKFGRSTDWMKLKPEEEVDCQITGYTEGKGDFEGTIGSMVAVDEEGQVLAFSGIPRALRDEINANREEYIGRIVEVRYMQRDSQGGYRHPRFYRFHPDKTEL